MVDSMRSGRGSGFALLAVAGLALAACQPAERSGGEGDTASAQDTAGAATSQDVIQMERSVWELLSEGDYAAFEEKLADDVMLVGGDGVVGKQELMSQLEGGTMESYEVGDFQVMQPGPDVAIVTYRYSETFRAADADSAADFGGWATSVWENRDGTWLVVLHQSSSTPPSTDE